jgi:catechol 2,3-dioxygenase-like lactoylglutathione lyase family enzyme
MSVTGVNHINIRTTDIAASARFYIEVFDFDLDQCEVAGGFQRNWLRDKSGKPIIHLRRLDAGSDSTGPIDHVALDCEDKAAILERLTARNMPFDVASLQPGATVVFVKDPHGVMLELNFRAD